MPPDISHHLGQGSARPYVLDIWAPWCAPCRRLEPVLAELESQYRGRVDVERLNADDELERVRDLGVVAIPTLIVFAGGREIARRTGALSRRDLVALFQAADAGTPPPPGRLLPQDRALRLMAAAAVLVIGLTTGPSWILVAFSAILFFSAVYDRCPIWRAISGRLSHRS